MFAAIIAVKTPMAIVTVNTETANLVMANTATINTTIGSIVAIIGTSIVAPKLSSTGAITTR